MKYATYNTDGSIDGFYDSDIHGDSIPVSAVPLTDAEWQDSIDNPGRRRIDTKTLKPVPYDPPIDAARLKASTRRAIDAAAERARQQYITPGPGQALVYQRKGDQARDCLANYDSANPPPAGAYPALEAEVGISGADVLAVAGVVAATADQWATVADQIEALRLGAKQAVDAVSDTDADIEAQLTGISEGIAWPAP